MTDVERFVFVLPPRNLAEAAEAIKVGCEWLAGRIGQVEAERDLARQQLAAERERIGSAIDHIEHEHYLHGMRCGDFKEALDLVRAALDGST